MKYIFITLLALFLLQCKEKENPIIEEPKPIVLNKPCYDSTYFDTTLIIMNMQFIDFTLKAPQGAIYKYMFMTDTEGGQIFYGCDTFMFSYGHLVNRKLRVEDYLTIDTIDFNGYNGVLGYGYDNTYDIDYYSLLISGDDEINYMITIKNPHYDYYADKLFRSFKFK